MPGCARCRHASWRVTRRRTHRRQAGHDRARSPILCRSIVPARARSDLRFRALQCEPHPVRQSGRGPRRAACADRPGRKAQLCRTLRRGLALGTRFQVARIAARRPHPDVPRRHAGLSGGVFRRGARRLRAAADQHADAARPAAILSVGFRRSRGRRRCRVLHRASTRWPARTRRLRTLVVVNGTRGRSAVPNAIAAEHGCRVSPPNLPKPTPTATRWRSGCIRRARPAGPRASSICITTWPIARLRLPARC